MMLAFSASFYSGVLEIGLAIKSVQTSDFELARILMESIGRDWPFLNKRSSSLHFSFGH